MSGISGKISFNENLSNGKILIEKMGNSLKHRGNFFNGISDENAVLIQNSPIGSNAFVKNSPLTLIDNDIKYTIVFDGAIFNAQEVRQTLISNKRFFETDSDEETVLKAYLEFGDNCLKLLNGVFAFAIWNSKNEELFLARDRFGIKPLFYSDIDGNLTFASEIKALFTSGIKAEIDRNSILEILLIGPGRTPEYAVFNNIYELAPATCAYYSKKGFRTKKFWQLYPNIHTDTPEQATEKIRYLVDDSIKRQIKCDMPLCTMLSGGLDSSIISAVVSEEFKKESKILDTYTVTYKDNDKYFTESKFQPTSDSDFYKMMNDYIGAKNHIVEIEISELVNALFSSVDARDLPGMADVDSSLLLFSKEIAKDYSVVLSGECSDEIFGGYPWYRDPVLRKSDTFPWAKSSSYRNSFLKEEISSFTDAEEFVKAKYEKAVNQTLKLNSLDTDERSKELMKLHLDWFMMTLVERSDRMSAYNSLEIRVPYCDYRIVEYLYNIPISEKDYKGFEKGLLRQAYNDMLPKEILWRKKSPYPKTHNPQYFELVKSELKKVLEDSHSPIFEFISKNSLSNLLMENSQQTFYGQLMTTPQTVAYFVQINYWLKKYNIKIKI